MGETGSSYGVSVGKPKGKRPLERPRLRWEGIIKIDLQEVVWGGGMGWIALAQDRDGRLSLVRAVMNLLVD